MAIALERVSKPRAKESVFVVKVNGVEVGLVSKFRDSRSVNYPWKAYAGVGAACRFLGAYYGEQEVAVNAVLAEKGA